MTDRTLLETCREFVTRHLQDVFTTMLSMKPLPAVDFEGPEVAGRVTGRVGMVGAELDSVLCLHLDDAFARRAAGAMLALTPGQVPDAADVDDVVGEITNMVAGGLKSLLNDLGAGCAMSTLGILRGSRSVMKTVPEVTRELLGFTCEGARILVDLQFQTKGRRS